ncbi:rhodanese-like domain-containing protein [Algoriphagus aestuarii]|nr:rhodanese-like domain-containing protein [Algoriphagus aestuarii]
MKARKISVSQLKAGLTVFFILIFNSTFSQSFAYKTLLSGIYEKDFPIVYPKEIKDLASYQVLDTREREEYEVSHLKDAQWVGFDIFRLENVESLDKDKPVLVYCTVGARSQEIGAKLQQAGFKKVFNLYGGIIQWSNDNLPLFHGGHPTNEVHTYSKSWGFWLNRGEKVY